MRQALLGVTVVALVLFSSCAEPSLRRPPAPTTGGPLGEIALKGGFSAQRPAGVRTFSVTFGSFLLCLTKGGEKATITSVVARDERASPFTAYLRSVTPAAVAAVAPRDRPDFAPVGAANGTPPDFDEPYVDQRLPVRGRFTTGVEGAVINETCAHTRGVGVVNREKVPKYTSTELMIAITAGREGAEVNGVVIDYMAGGEKYRRIVPWRMVVCDVANMLHNCQGRGGDDG